MPSIYIQPARLLLSWGIAYVALSLVKTISIGMLSMLTALSTMANPVMGLLVMLGGYTYRGHPVDFAGSYIVGLFLWLFVVIVEYAQCPCLEDGEGDQSG